MGKYEKRTLSEVLSSPEELQQRMRSSETVQKLAERVPQVTESARAHSYCSSKYIAGTENMLILAVNVLAVNCYLSPSRVRI